MLIHNLGIDFIIGHFIITVGIYPYPGKEKSSTSVKYQPQKSTKVTKIFLRFLHLFATFVTLCGY